MSRRKKSIIWPLLLAIGFSVPQALTYSEALQSGHSDWVLMSAGLLAAAGLCLMVVGYRLGRAVGLVVALALVGGVGFYGYQQVQEVKVRGEARYAQRRALEEAYDEMYALCKGGEPFARAAAYDAASGGGHPMVVFEMPREGGLITESTYTPPDPDPILYKEPFSQWTPETPEEAELVACVARTGRVVERCQYMGGTLHRIQRLTTVRVYALKTGEVVFEYEHEGSAPPACQASEEFAMGSTVTTRSGDELPIEEVGELLWPVAGQR